jgi:hypothetical protein
MIGKAKDPCELGSETAAGYPTHLRHEAVLIGRNQASGDEGCP